MNKHLKQQNQTRVVRLEVTICRRVLQNQVEQVAIFLEHLVITKLINQLLLVAQYLPLSRENEDAQLFLNIIMVITEAIAGVKVVFQLLNKTKKISMMTKGTSLHFA